MSTKIEIRHRSTGAVLWLGEDELRAAVVAAVRARAYWNGTKETNHVDEDRDQASQHGRSPLVG